jgi:hypothetical protein
LLYIVGKKINLEGKSHGLTKVLFQHLPEGNEEDQTKKFRAGQ